MVRLESGTTDCGVNSHCHRLVGTEVFATWTLFPAV